MTWICPKCKREHMPVLDGQPHQYTCDNCGIPLDEVETTQTPPNPLKFARIDLRVPEADKAKWQEAARGSGLGLSIWIRQMLYLSIVWRDGRWQTIRLFPEE